MRGGDQRFHDGGQYYIETSPLICIANQLTGFYMIWTSVMKELKNLVNPSNFLKNERCVG